MNIRQSITRSAIRGAIVFVLCVVIFALYRGTMEAILSPGYLRWPLFIGLVVAGANLVFDR
jgi:hypothetical protein